MELKRWLGLIAVAGLALFFATPAFSAIGNQGRILYTKGVVRDANNGVITSTKNLFVKDLATGTEHQVTNYSGNYSILNPMFNANGDKIIFTSNVDVSGNTKYKVYIVSADASVSAGVGIELQSSSDDYKYAALSPDEKTIVFVNNDSSLWAYYKDSGVYQQIYEDPINGITISNVVFVNDTTVAFIGESQGIQNIYTTDLTGPSTTNITNYTTGNQQYLSLKSGIRAGLSTLIYSKRTKPGTSWGPFDVYVATIPFAEVNVTNTNISGQNEYEACFYGDDAPLRDVPLELTAGNMLYSAKVIGSVNKIWQTNFNTAGGPTNTGKTQRTTEVDGDTGEVDWGPPLIEMAPITGIGDTEIVYTAGTPNQIWMADLNDSGVAEVQTQITTGSESKANPSLGAARVVYHSDSTSQLIYRMNPDGTNITEFVNISSTPFVPGLPSGANTVKMPSISPDGKWVVFVAGPSTGTQRICVKLLKTDASTAAINLNIGSHPEDPVISPDMSSIVWVENDAGMRSIKKINVVFDAEAGTANTIGTEITLGGNTGLFNDTNPSFSPDGTNIIFVSNRDGTSRIYTMDASTGLSVTRFPGLLGVTNPAYPVFSPLNDGSIAFVSDVGPERHIRSATSAGVLSALDITVNGDKFDWEIERTPGEIVAKRTLQSRAPAGTTLTYGIDIDVDDGQVPVAYTLSEVIPNWTVDSVKVDGVSKTAGTHYYVLNDTPVTGMNTLKFVFSNVGDSAGTVADHIITIDLTTAGTGQKSFSGEISYFINNQPQISIVLGNGLLSVLNPFCPVDIYNSTGLSESDGVIQDLDLLYGINAWAQDAQLPGYGTGWPSNPSTNWDGIILAVIQIWASPAGTQGYYFRSNGILPEQVGVTEASTKTGEYLFIGDRATSDGIIDLYATSTAVSGTPEMYWTQGRWSDD